jgi:hypothetical protein
VVEITVEGVLAWEAAQVYLREEEGSRVNKGEGQVRLELEERRRVRVRRGKGGEEKDGRGAAQGGKGWRRLREGTGWGAG